MSMYTTCLNWTKDTEYNSIFQLKQNVCSKEKKSLKKINELEHSYDNYISHDCLFVCICVTYFWRHCLWPEGASLSSCRDNPGNNDRWKFSNFPLTPSQSVFKKSSSKSQEKEAGSAVHNFADIYVSERKSMAKGNGEGYVGEGGAMHAEFLCRPCPPPSSQPPSLNLPVPFARVLKSISAANMTFIEKRLVPRPRRLLSFASPSNPLPRPLCFPPASNCRARCGGGVGRMGHYCGSRWPPRRLLVTSERCESQRC